MQRSQRLEQEKEDTRRSMTTLKKDWEKERKTRCELEAKNAELIRMSVCPSIHLSVCVSVRLYV